MLYKLFINYATANFKFPINVLWLQISYLLTTVSPHSWHWAIMGHRQLELLFRTRIYCFIIYIRHIMINKLHFCAISDNECIYRNALVRPDIARAVHMSAWLILTFLTSKVFWNCNFQEFDASANFMFQNLILEFYVLKFNPQSYINVVPSFVITVLVSLIKPSFG